MKKTKKTTKAQQGAKSGTWHEQAVADAMKAMACPPAASEKWGDEYLHELLDGYDEYAEWAEQDDKSKRPELSSRIQALGRRLKEAENIAQQVVPRLKKDLHDAGRRIEDLEMRERLNTYEVRAIHEALKAAGAPQTGTILERVRVLLAMRHSGAVYRAHPAPDGTRSAAPVPLRDVLAVQHFATHVDGPLWFERSMDGGQTWQRCDVRGEVLA